MGQGSERPGRGGGAEGAVPEAPGRRPKRAAGRGGTAGATTAPHADGPAGKAVPEKASMPEKTERKKAEPEKARTEIAAGDVADDLADFA